MTKGKTDALEAVKALSAWMLKNVEAALIAETLTGPEVLACRKGKCSEFATLFASLARAVGIPTRIALGERMIPGQWGGHMWNEVYVGRWIPVDAGANEVGTSFVLVKLIDHETVEGTQPLRQALPASFGIAIKDHRSKPSSLAGKFKTGIVGRIYTNAELGCRMTAPGDDWSIEEVKEPGAMVLRFKVPEKGKGDVQLHFVAFSLPVPLEPKVTARPPPQALREEPQGVQGHRRRAEPRQESGRPPPRVPVDLGHGEAPPRVRGDLAEAGVGLSADPQRRGAGLRGGQGELRQAARELRGSQVGGLVPLSQSK